MNIYEFWKDILEQNADKIRGYFDKNANRGINSAAYQSGRGRIQIGYASTNKVNRMIPMCGYPDEKKCT